MAIFIVRRSLPGLGRGHLAGVHRALAESARRLSAGGDRVRYVRCLYAPGRGELVCVFRATSPELVRRVNEVAQVPFDRIEEALAFERPGQPGSSPRGRVARLRGRAPRPTPRPAPGM